MNPDRVQLLLTVFQDMNQKQNWLFITKYTFIDIYTRSINNLRITDNLDFAYTAVCIACKTYEYEFNPKKIFPYFGSLTRMSEAIKIEKSILRSIDFDLSPGLEVNSYFELLKIDEKIIPIVEDVFLQSKIFPEMSEISYKELFKLGIDIATRSDLESFPDPSKEKVNFYEELFQNCFSSYGLNFPRYLHSVKTKKLEKNNKKKYKGKSRNSANESKNIYMRQNPFEDRINIYAYEEKEELGRGTFGIVSRYKHKIDKNTPDIAVKTVIDEDKKGEIFYDTIREISVLRNLVHKNIIKLLSYSINEIEIRLVFELAICDLTEWIVDKEKYDTKEIIKQILEGVDYIHSQNMIHRDLKPGNILIFPETVNCIDHIEPNTKSYIKIADFGSVRYGIEGKMSEGVCTIWYRAPEVLKDELYDEKGDIWSIGCILYQLTTRKVLFRGKDEKEQIRLIEERFSESNIFVSDELENDLLTKLLKVDPRERISAREALQHNYFR